MREKYTNHNYLTSDKVFGSVIKFSRRILSLDGSSVDTLVTGTIPSRSYIKENALLP